MDFSSLTIPEGEVIKIEAGDTVLWEAITYTNQVPISTDTDGSIFNGVGYIENKRLSSSGGISGSAQQGSVVTGFIPFTTGDATVIRMKGVVWLQATNTYSGHYYINFYDSNKKFLHYYSSGEVSGGQDSHIITVTRDANGVETVEFNQAYGTTNVKLQNIRNSAKYIRINAYGKGADFIVTINEEIS
jgi:hypothetical protein